MKSIYTVLNNGYMYLMGGARKWGAGKGAEPEEEERMGNLDFTGNLNSLFV